MLVLPDHLNEKFQEGFQLRKSGYRGRFAPSPTGPLHLGNLRTALVSWLSARLVNGSWFLRIDDLDTLRNKPGAAEKCQNDLKWLGLFWDGPTIFQSNRINLYNSLLNLLRNQGKLYACRCSRRKLLEASISLNNQARYPGFCRELNSGWEEFNGRLPSWRLKVREKFSRSCGDIILRRADGFIAYHFATVFDELTLGINEVIRGEDLILAQEAQLAVSDLFSRTPIQYKYTPLFLGSDGQKLSKRNDDFGLEGCKEQGLDPPKVIGLLAASLKLVPEGSVLSLNELLSELKARPSELRKILKK